MPRSVSVIVVTWNALEHLKKFLPSVTQTEYEDFEIIIADNASTDGSAEWVESAFPECNVVSLSENYGFCGGNNRAAAYARGEILVFLNNDVEVEKEWLKDLVTVFDSPEIAAAQPKIRSYAEKEKFEYAGAAGGFLDSLAYPFCRGRVFQNLEKDEGQYDDRTFIFWASGAAFAVRNNLFTEFGGFDEDFNFHMEEIDLCWRFLNRGYRIMFCPESTVYHLGGGSLPMNSSRKTFFNFRNSLMMIWKNAGTPWIRSRFLLRLCFDGLAGMYAVFRGNFGDAAAIVRAHFQFYRIWRKVHRKRKKLQALRTTDQEPAEMIRTSVVADYFLKGKKTFHQIVGSNSHAGGNPS
ncbi:MAG: glycosyltransferase family 2 protein [Balneolaceae bacterium]